MSRLSRWFLAAVACCMVLGFGIRWFDIAVARPVCDPPGADPDSDCYDLYSGPSDPLYGHLQGRLLAQGHWFVNPYVALSGPDTVAPVQRAIDVDPSGPFQRSVGDPPLYQAFLGGLSAAGIESGQAHRHASALVGLACIPLLALLARRLAGEPAGVLAAFVAAVHPLLWINDGMLLSEALYAPLIAATLLAAIRFRDRPSAVSVAVVAFLISAAAFTRGEAALLLPLLVPVLVLGTRRIPLSQRWSYGAIALAVVGAWFLPWNLWINAEFEERVFMTSASGSVLSASACDEHFYGDPLAIFIYCGVDVEITDDLDESQRDALVRDAALDYIGDNAGRLPVVASARVGRMWDVYGPADNLDQDIGVEARGDLPSRAGLAIYYALAPFALVGLIALARRREQVWPYVSLAIMVSVTAATTFGLTRYRVPVDVAMIALAAVGVDACVRAVIERRAGGAGDPSAPTPTSAATSTP